MKISVLEAVQNGNSTLSHRDINPQELANLWSSGITISARLAEPTGRQTSAKFDCADTVMVHIDLAQLPLNVAMAADFTQRHATVACYKIDDEGGQLLLAFQLPTTINDSKKYCRLLSGLEAIYAGAVLHGSTEQGFGLAIGGTATVLGSKLDAEAVRFLDDLGRESKELRKGRGAYLRSHVTLDKTTVVTLPGGETFTLERLPKELDVFCPVHVDAQPTGVVHWYADGTPGIQCSHCRRTYAAPMTKRDYDFGLFDRAVKALAAAESSSTVVDSGVEFGASGVTYLAERYLPPIAVEHGALFIKSPKGTGKTEALANLVEQCRKKHLRVLLLGHRRSLLQSISERLGLDCYFVNDDLDEAQAESVKAKLLDLEDDSQWRPEPISSEADSAKAASYRQVAPKSRYAICLDSIENLDPSDKDHQYQVVIIDEAEQVFAHLTGETLKTHRRDVFSTLSYYLRTAKHVVLLDADLNMITMTAAFNLLKPELPARIIVNEPNISQGDIHLYSHRGQLAKLLTDTVGAGKKVYVATNSKKKAIDLSKLLAEHNPGKRVAVVTADNSQWRETQELLGDITRRFESDLDVLIASPAIGTGIDITFKDQNGNPRKVVDATFGFFEANIVTHFDIDQQLMRVRHPGEVHVWVDTTTMNYETDVGCIKRELQKSVRKTGLLLRYEDDGSPVFADDYGLVDIWAQVTAATRGSKNRLAQYFRALRAEGGWNLVDVEYDESEAAFGQVALAAAKEARLVERKEKLLTADRLSEDEASRLEELDKCGAPLTDRERDALGRYQIENFYADGEISSELIDFDSEGRRRECVMRLECLMSKCEWFELRDDDDIANGVLAFDRKRYVTKRNVLESILAASGLFSLETQKFKTGVVVEAAALKDFLHELEVHGRQVEALFGVPLYTDRWRNPIGQLKGILGLIGLDLENVKTEQKNSKKVRRYGICNDLLSRMTRAVKQRDLKYRREKAERIQGEDRVVRSASNRMNASLADFVAKNRKKEKRQSSVSAQKKQSVIDAFRRTT